MKELLWSLLECSKCRFFQHSSRTIELKNLHLEHSMCIQKYKFSLFFIVITTNNSSNAISRKVGRQ